MSNMRITFHHTKEWKQIVGGSLILLLSFLFIEMLFHKSLSEQILKTIDIFDILFTTVLAIDLILWYNEAKNKYNFIRRNWIKIIAVFPFMLVFRGIQFLRLEQFVGFAFSGEIIKDILSIERLLKYEKGVKLISKATELISEL